MKNKVLSFRGKPCLLLERYKDVGVGAPDIIYDVVLINNKLYWILNRDKHKDAADLGELDKSAVRAFKRCDWYKKII